MKYFLHKIEKNKHQSLLQENRKDPVTGEQIKAGDTIVICAHCKSAFLQKSWEYMGGKHCGQSKTIEVLSNTKGKIVEINQISPIENKIPQNTQKTTNQLSSINWTFIIIVFLLSVVAIIFILNNSYQVNNRVSIEEQNNTLALNSDIKTRLKNIVKKYYKAASDRNLAILKDIFAIYLTRYYTINETISKDIVLKDIQSHWQRSDNEEHNIIEDSWNIEQNDNAYLVKFLLEYRKNNENMATIVKVEMQFNENFELFYLANFN